MKIRKRLVSLIMFTFIFAASANAQTIGSGNSYHLLVANNTGDVYSWGRNDYGQIGDNTTANKNTPTAVESGGVLSGKNITFITTGLEYSVAVSSDGYVYTWGRNYLGQLGNNTSTDSHVPVSVITSGTLSGKTILSVAAGYHHCIALDSDGKLYSWGGNEYGQLGIGTTAITYTPVKVVMNGALSGKTVTAVAAGNYHSAALTSDGKVYTWGYNGHGQIGDNTSNHRYAPVQVYSNGALAGKTIVAIAASQLQTLALASDGTIYSWGYNRNGQLGNNSTTDSNVPVQVNNSGVLSGKTITSIAAGNNHSAALASDGTVYTWGSNNNGQLGNGTNTDSHIPVAVISTGALSGKNVIKISAGLNITYCLADDDYVYAWGVGNYGQLGNGSNSGSNVPVMVDNQLPVELSSFTASIIKNSVLLKWETATEINNFGFEIERQDSEFRSQNSEWEVIGFLDGAGNSNSSKQYSFVDNSTMASKARYRLKQIDNDGSFEYSNIVEVNLNLPVEFNLSQNYPNPFNPATTINFTIPVGKENVRSLLKVYDMLGNEIATLMDEPKTPGNHEVKFDASKFTTGIYFYTLTLGNLSETKKMLLLK